MVILAKPLGGFVFEKAATRLFILTLESLTQVFYTGCRAQIARKTVFLKSNSDFLQNISKKIECSAYIENYEKVMNICYVFQYFNDYMLMAQSSWYLLQTIYLANLTLCNFGVLAGDTLRR